jgi:hypothetical protein
VTSGCPPGIGPRSLRRTMADLSPSQRTAGTGRILLTAGALLALEAMWQGSVTRTLIASALLVVGGGLVFVAKRAD